MANQCDHVIRDHPMLNPGETMRCGSSAVESGPHGSWCAAHGPVAPSKVCATVPCQFCGMNHSILTVCAASVYGASLKNYYMWATTDHTTNTAECRIDSLEKEVAALRANPTLTPIEARIAGALENRLGDRLHSAEDWKAEVADLRRILDRIGIGAAASELVKHDTEIAALRAASQEWKGLAHTVRNHGLGFTAGYNELNARVAALEPKPAASTCRLCPSPAAHWTQTDGARCQECWVRRAKGGEVASGATFKDMSSMPALPARPSRLARVRAWVNREPLMPIVTLVAWAVATAAFLGRYGEWTPLEIVRAMLP